MKWDDERYHRCITFFLRQLRYLNTLHGSFNFTSVKFDSKWQRDYSLPSLYNPAIIWNISQQTICQIAIIFR